MLLKRSATDHLSHWNPSRKCLKRKKKKSNQTSSSFFCLKLSSTALKRKMAITLTKKLTAKSFTTAKTASVIPGCAPRELLSTR